MEPAQIGPTRIVSPVAAATEPAPLHDVLERAVASVRSTVTCSLVALFDRRDDRLVPRAMAGPLTTSEMRQHAPVRSVAIQRAIETRMPQRIDDVAAELFAGRSPLPAGQAGLVIPLTTRERVQAILLLVRSTPQRFDDAEVSQAVSLGVLISIVGSLSQHAAELTEQLRLSRTEEIAAPRSPAASPLGDTSAPSLLPLREAVRLHLIEALRRTDAKIYGPGGAAQLLALKPTTLQSKLKKHGIERLEVVKGETPAVTSQGPIPMAPDPPDMREHAH